VTVTGPAGNASVKSLEIGSANALRLTAGSNLVTASGVTVDTGGLLAGTGTITGMLSNHGTVSPGSSAGAISIIGDYSQTGRLDLELLGNAFDHLDVTGSASLAGDIYVLGAATTVGQTFDVLTAAGISGSLTFHFAGPGSSAQVVSLAGGGQALRVTYVPEPAQAVLVLLASIPLLRRRQRFVS
jgi:hypothetical protein